MPRPLRDLLPPGVTVLAHRGWSSRAPENTHAAYELAAAAGFGIELDVQLNADGTLVCLHDDRLDRTTTATGPVDMASDAVTAHLDATGGRAPPEPLPTLPDVLARYGSRVLLDVEIKPPRQRGARWRSWDHGVAVADAIVAAGLQDRLFVTSFDPFVLQAVRERAPAIRRGQLFATFRDSDLSLPAKWVLRHRLLDHRSRPDLLAAEHVLVTAARVRRWKAAGHTVLTWTVDDPERARALARMGVDVIVSNDPGRIQAALAGA